jgi:N utilization substance protein B
VELAKLYGSDSAPRFVNGVLGSLADHTEELVEAATHEPGAKGK